MRLLNVHTLKLETFYGATPPPYAILSHTWGEEITFADIENPFAHSITSKKGYDKISKTCAQAKSDGYDYIRIDTCCIDKSSRAELSEAINSMFQWYKASSNCYAFLVLVLLGRDQTKGEKND
jgi:hypothetical protein